jgi:hypothetical protein
MKHYLAIDLGADSGRAMLGTIAGGRLVLEELHRFPNTPVRVPTGLYWDTFRLFHEILEGLRIAGRERRLKLDGIGIDTWGVDFGLLGADGAVFSLANVAPRTSVELYEACVRGDLAEAKRLQRIYNQLFRIFSIVDQGSGSIAGALGGLKVGLELLGLASSRVRLPGRQASDDEKARIEELLRQIPETAERLGAR